MCGVKSLIRVFFDPLITLQTCVQYAKPQESNVNDFPLAYHYLIHSAAMQIVLKLEAKYQSSLSKVSLK